MISCVGAQFNARTAIVPTQRPPLHTSSSTTDMPDGGPYVPAGSAVRTCRDGVAVSESDGMSPLPASRRLRVTKDARRAMADLRETDGAQALLLSWPAGVACLPAAVHTPSPYEAIIGHVSGCPIYADVRQLAMFRDRHAVLDARAHASTVRPRRPLLRLR